MDHHPLDRPGEPDPYRLLGLGPNPTIAQINSAYRRAVRRQHPDTQSHQQPPPDADEPERPALAQLQAARAQLIRQAHGRSHERPDVKGQSAPGRPGNPPDIIVGPVRYHGTPR